MHFTEKTPASSEYFTKMRENKKQSSESLSHERLQIKTEGGKGELKRKQGDECYPLLCYKSLFLPFVSISYPSNTVKRSITGGA